MKAISKSKRQLAQLLIEAGVKQFPEGADWAAQDRDTIVHDHPICFYANKPHCNKGSGMWNNDVSASCVIDNLSFKTIIPNWHQTVLSRAEFDQIVAESADQSKPDADGWIEWKGGECPVDGDLDVSVKVCGENSIGTGKAKSWSWRHCGDGSDIIAYRLHKPEHTDPQYCESVTRAIHEPVTAPTLDQLLHDYRNAVYFATSKQAEADEAVKMCDERWKKAQERACELGVRISAELVVDAEMRESEPAITDWRDLLVGDEIEVLESPDSRYDGLIGVVSRFNKTDHKRPVRVIFGGCEDDFHWPSKWRFIRRP